MVGIPKKPIELLIGCLNISNQGVTLSNAKNGSDMFISEDMLNETERKIYCRIIGVFRHSKVPSSDGKENVIGVISCSNKDLNILALKVDDRLRQDGICLSEKARRSVIRWLLNRMNGNGELVYQAGRWSIPALAEEASRKKKSKKTSRKEKRRRLNPLPA